MNATNKKELNDRDRSGTRLPTESFRQARHPRSSLTRSIKVLSMLYYGGLGALSNVCVITQEVFIPCVFLMKRRDCCLL